MKMFSVNSEIILTESVKQNLSFLSKKGIECFVEKDIFSNQKYWCFYTKLFDSNCSVVVKFKKSLFRIKELIIVTAEEFKSHYYSDDSFKLIQNVLNEKYGTPSLCNGTDECLFYKEKDCSICHCISEVRMGTYTHEILVNFTSFTRPGLFSYKEYCAMKEYVLSCVPAELNLSGFYFNGKDIYFVLSYDVCGYYCHRIKNKMVFIPFDVINEVQNGRIIRYKPRIEKKTEQTIRSLEEIKSIIKDYFNTSEN